MAADPQRRRQDVAAEIWESGWPSTELGMFREGLAFFTARRAKSLPANVSRDELISLAEHGAVSISPIVYEDFLPRSAAGIFASNLTSDGTKDAGESGVHRDIAWLSDVLGVEVYDPMELYREQERRSIAQTRLEPVAV